MIHRGLDMPKAEQNKSMGINNFAPPDGLISLLVDESNWHLCVLLIRSRNEPLFFCVYKNVQDRELEAK